MKRAVEGSARGSVRGSRGGVEGAHRRGGGINAIVAPSLVCPMNIFTCPLDDDLVK